MAEKAAEKTNENENVISLADVMKDVRAASENITAAENHTTKSLAELKQLGTTLETGQKSLEAKVSGLETGINELYKRNFRPGQENGDYDFNERKAALDYLRVKHDIKLTTKDADHPFRPSEDEIKTAIVAHKAMNAAMNTANLDSLSAEYRKSLTSFAFGSNGFILPPQMGDRVISCIVDPTDLSGLMDSMTIARPSVQFMIDNQRMAAANWACEASCFHNNPLPDLQEGLGQMEIKAETIRFIVCMGRDLLEDAAIDMENWILTKCSRGMRATINQSIINGDGVGKPLGILNPQSGIPICETSVLTPVGQFTWQDLYQLKYDIPMEWHAGGSYLMNQRTFSLLQTMSTAEGRPLFSQMPQGQMTFQIAGSPIVIATQMPDVAPGSTPVAYGNWKEVYLIVWRRAVTIQQDPYSAGWCILYKFDARVGGGIKCPNAARLLRIK